MKLTPGTKEHGGKTYKTLMFEDNKIEYTFTIENADLDVGEGCSYYNNDSSMAAKYGRLYTWDAAMKTKPKGWHLIDFPRWDLLREKFTAAQLIDGGSSGFNFQYGGRFDHGYIEQGKFGQYWSETEQGPDYAYLKIFEKLESGGCRIIENNWEKNYIQLSKYLTSINSVFYECLFPLYSL